ncbi:acyl-CoA Delta(11) desaturase-like [Leguminivora glycinivorella]|uniref:acyl-CoA Delta(11) desaturase-like n=1 Tax=Leguminivora glycinivorella TaxID=1035111 RepID=UPI00200E31D6|nr:acyl-CoA Delta(11) desaturase-like [Leguminivora glycinivorella]
MPPNVSEDYLITERNRELPKLVAPQADDWKFQLSYSTVVFFGYFYLAALYGLYLCFTSAHWATIIFAAVLLEVGQIGVLAGAHRLWSHKSYEAKLPLQILLIIFQSVSSQWTAFNWVKEHRIHHEFSDTDADPYNSTRGLFFSHVGWMLVNKHPELKKRRACIDMSDMRRNPVVSFQYKYGFAFIATFAYIIPTLIPMYLWGETLMNAYFVNILRTIICQNCTSLVNSFAHAYGNKPYDKNLTASENMLAHFGTLGEGFHNYHHVFPWDYRSSELGSSFNLPAAFIEFFAKIGWAYNLKTAEYSAVAKRAKRCGDGTFKEVDLKNEECKSE